MSATGEKDMFRNASGALMQKSLFMDEKTAYEAALSEYEKKVKAWNSAVSAVEAEYLDDARVMGEVRGPRGRRESSLTALPLKPVAPTKPAAFAGIDILSTDVSYYSGFGTPTAGMLSSNNFKYGMYKTFGRNGQGHNA